MRYLAGLAIVLLTSVAALRIFGRAHLADVVLVYVLAVVVVSMSFGRGPALATSVLCVLAYDFVFVPPYYELSVDDPHDLVTFGVMLFVALVISTQNARLRRLAADAAERERRTARLYAMSRELSAAHTRQELVRVAARHLEEVFRCRSAVLLPSDDRTLTSVDPDSMSFLADEQELAIATWVWTRHEAAGLGSRSLPGARARYVPLRAAHTFTGVLAAMPEDRGCFDARDQQLLLEAFASQIALAVERSELGTHRNAS